MTKQIGDLSPPQSHAVVKECINCAKIRKQAEDAFLELRTQTDRHIQAVQKKLKDDHTLETTKLRGEIDSMEKELLKTKQALKAASRTDEIEKRVTELRKDYEGRLAVLKGKLDESESRLAKYQEDSLRSARRDHLLRDARVNELEKENENFSSEIDRLEIELQSLRSKLDKAKLDQEASIERETRKLMAERDDARERQMLAEERLKSQENLKRDYEIDKAKMDLNYRRRIGEMESEIRKTEIESVRLRREIVQLSQRLEQSEPAFPRLNSARSRLFAIEAGSGGVPSSKSGTIAKIGIASPKRSPRAVEELPPHTPSLTLRDD